IDVCRALDPQHLDTAVPGTYGSILETQRHLVGADSWYLFDTSRQGTPPASVDQMDLSALRIAMVSNGTGWSEFLRADLDPDVVLREVDPDDGYEKLAPVGIRLAQVLHHGTDHRSQICTALTSLGVEPPAIDAWDFGAQDGRVVEVFPPTS
ncbi:MAG: hypothetical protein QOG88_1002, partial [Actinomycetota bacterium]|nr:hypothetical protein [Actinomycetota bacterium]